MSSKIEQEFADALAAINAEEADKADQELTPEHKALGQIAAVVRKNFYSDSGRKANVRQQIEEIVDGLDLK